VDGGWNCLFFVVWGGGGGGGRLIICAAGIQSIKFAKRLRNKG